MTPPDRDSVALLRAAVPDLVGGGLDDLLADAPVTAGTGAAALAAAASLCIGTDVTVAVRTGDSWAVVAGGEPVGTPSADVRRRAGQRSGSVVGGRVALLWNQPATIPPDLAARLSRSCVWLSLAVERDEAIDGAARAAAETAVISDVVGRLLSVRDVDQLLLSIADRTRRLLDADICGVLLREGDEVRMRSCVGNRVIDTSRLRMKRGQGVAGLVFLTGEPARVDDYLGDRTISRDFISLAEQEETQSALAVPLRLHGELVGVLEVWRRRPSLFTDQDLRRMVTLADFATIAIGNARLLDEQACAVAQLKEARDALESQVAVLARSSGLQQSLLTAVVAGAGLPMIARTVVDELGCQVGIYGANGELITSHGGRSLGANLPFTVPSSARDGRTDVRLPDRSDAVAWLKPIHADGDQIGTVCMLAGEQSAETMDVVAGQVAMACSLTLLRQRVANQARAEALEQVLWDLVQGSLQHRIAARARAQQMNVALGGELRVFYGQIENVEELAAEYGWDTSETDRVRRAVLRTVRTVGEGKRLPLTSLRGDLIIAIASNLASAAAKDLVSGLTTAVRRERPALRLTWGVSRAHQDVVELPVALNEARVALSAAHRLGGENVFLYEELGIVRLLLHSGSDPDLQTFIDDVTGPLIAYDRDNDGSLIRTLRAFFDADCSQRVASERLFIHHKTLRYRLERIKQLTGLDLGRHEDRVRADVALRLLQVNGTASEEATAGAAIDDAPLRWR